MRPLNGKEDAPQNAIAEQSRRVDACWLVVCGVLSSLWCLTASSQLSATWDEPTYLSHGLHRWRMNSVRPLVDHGTMPLPVDAATLPLYLYERWRGTPFDAEADLRKLLPWARCGTLVFWWVLLIYGGLLGRRLAGPWGGRLAVSLLACEPTLLAHAGLATTDLCLAACLVALTYHFHAGRELGWRQRIGWPAFWMAGSLLAKVSGLAYAPLCLLAVEAERVVRLWRERAGGAAARWPWRWLPAYLRPVAKDGAQILAGGFLLMLLYCASDAHPVRELQKLAGKLPEGPAARAATWAADHLLLANTIGDAYIFQVRHNRTGHSIGCYLLGLGPEPHWYHFPLTLSMKLTVPILALAGALLLLRPRALVNAACLAALALLLFSLTARIQIGVRLILPAVALGVVGLAAAGARALRDAEGWRLRLPRAMAAVGILWLVVSLVRVWPHGLCYTNELWGGTERGYRVLADSNYDWGQGVKDLEHWRRQHGVERLAVSYFGQRCALAGLPLDPAPNLWGVPLDGPGSFLERERGHILAVSATLLYGYGDYPAANYLRGLEPMGRTATFFIYDLRPAEKQTAARSR